MPRIRSITLIPRAPSLTRVVLDDDQEFVLPVSSVSDLHLHVGDDITLQRDELMRLHTITELQTRALRMLAARAHSRTELQRKLTRRTRRTASQSPVDPQWVSAALDALTARGLLNDASYAEDRARSQLLRSGRSQLRVEQDLIRRGVDRSTARNTVKTVVATESIDFTAIVEQAANKKLRSLKALDPATARRRLYAYLLRQGFDSAIVRKVVQRVFAQSALDAMDDE